MMFLTNRNYVEGLVVKKIRYKDYHEILHILTKSGYIESFFYENVYKSKKKLKVSPPYEVSINFFQTPNMNKITDLEIINSYQNIVYDVMKNSYVANMLEIATGVVDSNINRYKLLKFCLDALSTNYNEKIVVSFFLIRLLNDQGFMFKYQKTDKKYVGYSFLRNNFVDQENIDNTVFGLKDYIVKLIYYMSTKNLSFFESLEFDNKDLVKLFSFLNILFREYIGIETKSYKKIIELEEVFEFERKEDLND